MSDKPLGAPETGWLSAKQIADNAFRECLNDTKFKESFQETHWESLCERANSLFKASQKLTIFNLIMAFALFASKSKTPLELSFAGVALKSIADLQEPILVALSLSLVVQAVVAYAYLHLEAIIDTFISATNTESQAVFIRPIYTYYKSWIPALEKGTKNANGKSNVVVGWLVLLSVSFFIFLFFTTIFLELIVIYIVASTAMELIASDSPKGHDLRWIVGSISFGAIAVRVMFSLIQMPLPYKHYPNLDKLNQLEKLDAKEHERQLLLWAQIDTRSRVMFKRWMGSIVGALVTIVGPSLVIASYSLVTLSNLTLLFSCIVIVGFAGAYISEKLRDAAIMRFVRKYPPSSLLDPTERLRKFGIVRRRQNALWLLLCAALAVISVVLHRSISSFADLYVRLP